MESPRVDPTGVVEVPVRYGRRPRAWSRTFRVLAGLILAVFFTVGVVTTVRSLGAYCLTTDAANTTALDESARSRPS